MKRIFDIFVSLLLATLFSLVMLIVAIAIWFDSPGPIVFRQIRIGKNCKPFTIYKFRSMVQSAEKEGGYSTHTGDPRVSRVGRFIRKYSLDELPQLVNVIRGDMSLVGPRPDVPAQEACYAPADWEKRHRVRPGITGLAQATVRSSAAPGERLRLDLKYVDSASIWQDLKIILLTVRQVIFRGSY